MWSKSTIGADWNKGHLWNINTQYPSTRLRGCRRGATENMLRWWDNIVWSDKLHSVGGNSREQIVCGHATIQGRYFKSVLFFILFFGFVSSRCIESSLTRPRWCVLGAFDNQVLADLQGKSKPACLFFWLKIPVSFPHCSYPSVCVSDTAALDRNVLQHIPYRWISIVPRNINIHCQNTHTQTHTDLSLSHSLTPPPARNTASDRPS